MLKLTDVNMKLGTDAKVIRDGQVGYHSILNIASIPIPLTVG